MSILNRAFKLVDASNVDASYPKLVALPRAVATELVLLSISVPFAVSDLSAVFREEVFCTDASLERGAICSAKIPLRLSRVLWSGLRSKGAYHHLLSPTEALTKRIGLNEELLDEPRVSCSRPLAFHYDFIEIFAGASVVTAAGASLGFCVGPPIDLSSSPEFNMEWVHVISWLSFLISSGRVLSFMVSPPCTTFSLMRRALRASWCPFGFDTSDEQTHNGNLLAHRGLQLLQVGYQNEVPGLFETPFGALLRHLPSFKSFLGKPYAQQQRCDSCMYGSIHLKSFRFLAVHLSLHRLSKRCDKSHVHVVIEARYSKESAIYVPMLAKAIALSFKEAIESRRSRAKKAEEMVVRCHETQLANSVALSSYWKVDAVWSFRKPCHINILEMSALNRLAERLAKRGQSLRVTALMDSFVCSAATSKGRTSSLGLAPPLRRFCATSVDLSVLLDLPRLRRWSSNWVRLVLSLCGPAALLLSNRSLYRQSLMNTLDFLRVKSLGSSQNLRWILTQLWVTLLKGRGI